MVIFEAEIPCLLSLLGSFLTPPPAAGCAFPPRLLFIVHRSLDLPPSVSCWLHLKDLGGKMRPAATSRAYETLKSYHTNPISPFSFWNELISFFHRCLYSCWQIYWLDFGPYEKIILNILRAGCATHVEILEIRLNIIHFAACVASKRLLCYYQWHRMIANEFVISQQQYHWYKNKRMKRNEILLLRNIKFNFTQAAAHCIGWVCESSYYATHVAKEYILM